jgi:hypothetical protein
MSFTSASKSGFFAVVFLFLTTISLLAGEDELLLTRSVLDVSRVDGTTFLHSATTNIYDAHGRVKQKITVSEVTYAGLTVPGRQTTLFEYDKKGNLLFSDEERFDSEGNVQSRSLTSHTNLNKNQAQETTLTSWGSDSTFSEIAIVTSTYDPHERLIQRETDYRNINDNLDGGRWIETWTYDVQDDREVYLIQLSYRGVAGAGIRKVYRLDHRDNPISFVSEISILEPNIQFFLYYPKSGTSHYDKSGNLIQSDDELVDWQGNDFGTSIERYSYDQRKEVIDRSGELEEDQRKPKSEALHNGPGLSAGSIQLFDLQH